MKSFTKFRLRHIDAGVDWSAALTHSGDLFTWGNNHNGQLGTNNTRRRLVPTVITSLRRHGEYFKRRRACIAYMESTVAIVIVFYLTWFLFECLV